MKTLITLALFSFVALVLVPARASASTAADCQLLIVALSEQTAATTFLREDKGVKTELQLQHHLAKTSTELDQLDLRTALRQMRDFESDVTNAVGSAVLTASDGAAL
ncbi:MAG: hypothetical protein ACJ79V_09765, partial [Myxococcales bacterium]